jgi:predicted aspartyl protease
VTANVAFEYLEHVLTVPLRAAGIETRFILDTGIGLNLISAELAARVGCQPDGTTFTGHRMSGQAVTIPLGTLPSLDLGAHSARQLPVGIFDMHAMAGLDGVAGFLSLTYFRTVPVTIDYAAGLLILEDEQSLAARAARGTCVDVQVDRDGCSTGLLLGVDLPSGRAITVEVDTGSNGVVLDESLAADVGIDLHLQGIRTHEGTDETGHKFTRYFGTMSGDISVSGASQYRVTGPEVMFQKIIYDGLVGDGFLRNFTTTYDLENKRMIFNTRPGTGTARDPA